MSKMPQAWLEASQKVEAGTEVSAGHLDMSAEVAGAGLCPECREPMVEALADNIPVLVCEPDNIALPLKDEADESGE